jgi:hypothetical protein
MVASHVWQVIELLLTGAQVTYELGTSVHGIDVPIGPSPLAKATIDLGTGEYFTSISGTLLTYSGSPSLVRGVASLTFQTNRQAFGPFGFVTANNPFQVQGPVYALHGAVRRTSTPEILTAIGFWKPAG